MAAPGGNPLKALLAPALLIGINKSGVDLADETNQMYVRCAFGAVCAATLLGWLWVRSLVTAANQTKDHQRCTVKTKPPGAAEETSQNMSWMEYDLSEVQKQISSQLMGMLVSGGLHYWKGITQPLLLQCVMMPMGFMDSPLFSIHVRGKHLARPFPAPPNPLADLLKGPEEKKEEKEEKEEGEEAKEGSESKKGSKKKN